MKELSGILLVDKQAGWSSFDVVNKVRSLFSMHIRQQTGERHKVKVGHSGTLDPFATGLMILAVGKTTKELDKYMKLDKVYEATMVMDAYSDTGDKTGEITAVTAGIDPGLEPVKLDCVFQKMVGEIEQVPPAYSAIKVDGKRAYERARSGEAVEIEPRKVTIYELGIDGYVYPELKFSCRVSSGTYVRTLADDIAKKLGSRAYLTELRRTEVGDYSVADALAVTKDLSVEDLQKHFKL